ncbi:hypothetical protein CR513_07565, partial [Mucuna pruriens]
MPITRNQASSTNEGEEDTLQRLLRAIASLQARSDEQSCLSAEAEQRHTEAEERHRLAEERHLDAMRAAEKREEELCQQIAALRAAGERDQEEYEEMAALPFWGQPFSREIDETSLLMEARTHIRICKPFRRKCISAVETIDSAASCFQEC